MAQNSQRASKDFRRLRERISVQLEWPEQPKYAQVECTHALYLQIAIAAMGPDCVYCSGGWVDEEETVKLIKMILWAIYWLNIKKSHFAALIFTVS